MNSSRGKSNAVRSAAWAEGGPTSGPRDPSGDTTSEQPFANLEQRDATSEPRDPTSEEQDPTSDQPLGSLEQWDASGGSSSEQPGLQLGGKGLKDALRSRLVGLLAAPVLVGLVVSGCAASSEEAPSNTASASSEARQGGSAQSGGGSSLTETGVQPVKKPVSIGSSAKFGNGVEAQILSTDSVNVQADGPGEVSGPGALIEVQFTNNSGETINLDTVVMTMVYGAAKIPADPVFVESAEPLVGTLDSGAQASGSYVYRIPKSERGDVDIWLDYAASQPIVVFSGSVA